MPNNQEILRQSLLDDLNTLHKNLDKNLDHRAIAANRKSQNGPRISPSKQCAIGSQHAEDFDGNGLAF